MKFINRSIIYSFGFSFYMFCFSDLVAQKRAYTTNERRLLEISKDQTKKALTFTDKALEIGDKVPDFLMRKIFNHSGGKARLSDFEGKLIILDFWSRYCGSCISAFPKMEDLQLEFLDQIKILAVCTYNTWEAMNIVEPGFPQNSTSQFIRDTRLPLVFNSKEMTEYFPHRSEPYIVLINERGIISALTESDVINSFTIRAILSGEKVNFPLARAFRVVKDSNYLYDDSYPILKEKGGRLGDNVIYLKRSEDDPQRYLLLAKLGIRSQTSTSLVKDTIAGEMKVIGWRSHMNTLRNLYSRAYGPVADQFVIIDSEHPEEYYSKNDPFLHESWIEKNTYTLEQVGWNLNDSLSIEALKEALEGCFSHIRAWREKKKIQCIVLKRATSIDHLKTRFPDYHNSKQDISSSHFIMKNYQFKDFIQILQFYNIFVHKYSTIPIIDETEYIGNIDIELINPVDIDGLDRQLASYGLCIERTEREVEVLVISDRKVSFSESIIR